MKTEKPSTGKEEGDSCNGTCNDCHCIENRSSIQFPRVNTAARYGLTLYAHELRTFTEATGDRVALAMVDCINFLLIEAERLEGGSHE